MSLPARLFKKYYPAVKIFQVLCLFIILVVCPAQAKTTKKVIKSAENKKSIHHDKLFSYAAQQRMHNRAILLAKFNRQQKQQQKDVVAGDGSTKAALRAQNRKLIEQHPEWFPGPYRASDSHWHHLQDGTSLADNDHLENTTQRIIDKLQHQLGKPYVWGGESPDEGFDCSGLIFYAYNNLLAAKLPRTANEMYHYKRARQVADNDLRRGDLIFFHIHTRDTADHVGVYLGDGRFIESPRSGERIRISYLSDAFWQDHYLGARRILTDNTIL